MGSNLSDFPPPTHTHAVRERKRERERKGASERARARERERGGERDQTPSRRCHPVALRMKRCRARARRPPPTHPGRWPAPSSDTLCVCVCIPFTASSEDGAHGRPRESWVPNMAHGGSSLVRRVRPRRCAGAPAAWPMAQAMAGWRRRCHAWCWICRLVEDATGRPRAAPAAPEASEGGQLLWAVRA